jgi:DNA-binding beta-propeller fold protein YncE
MINLTFKLATVAVLSGLLCILASCDRTPILTSAAILEPTPILVTTTSSNFDGRYLLALSDADMLPSAYVDGQLGDRISEPDALTIFTLPLNVQTEPAASNQVQRVAAPNAVTAWPFSLAVSPNGRAAFVIETSEPAPSNATRFDQLPMGKTLRSLDVSDLSRPKLVDTLEVGFRPEAVDIRPSGDLLAVTTSRQPGRQLHLIPVDGAKLGKPQSFAISGVAGRGEVSGVRWHPSGQFLAVTIGTRNQIAFYKVTQEQGNYQLRAWGNPVQVGQLPVGGSFTPDGKFFVSNSVHWGVEVDGFFVGAPPGSLTSIRFDADSAKHQIAARVQTGVSPEGIAMAPDGSLIATANLVRSFLPKTDSRFTDYSSVSLIQLDRVTGKLQSAGEYRLAGQVLPQGIAFDAKGQNLAISSFTVPQSEDRTGAIRFFRIVPGTVPKLEQTGSPIDVVRGVHQLVLIP